MPAAFSVRSNLKNLQASLHALAYKQLPFATAQALNTLAQRVQVAETGQLKATFRHPKPFTVNSVARRGATKRTLTATVFIRPIAAAYLTPYEEGGVHVLAGRALLNPKNIPRDRYGQLPRTLLKRLKARPDIFIGAVKTTHGIVNGVWQRPLRRAPATVRSHSRTTGAMARGANRSGTLKLLIRFGDALPVTQRLHFGSTAQKVIDRGFDAAFREAMAHAVASAR
ncbi:hypothetical protein [Dyella japonica]|uniref:Uncharacterized protein n=1 Tax=Dyella japonica TaxID=231455 RepID=A0ABV2K3R7_9GAMM